jgi:serine protease Do
VTARGEKHGRWPANTLHRALILLIAASPVAQARAQETASGYANLVAGVASSVVNISVRTMGLGGQGSPVGERDFVGSGFIIDPTGYIVTNRHVVINSFAITVGLSDGTRLAAHVVGHPPATDIALLKVDTNRALPAVEFGDSDSVRVGDRVLAVGNPLGLGGTVTFGIVSALNRDTGDSPYDNFIQTDAAINHGNSGGPLFNMEGKVIGVDSALISDTTGSIGLGLAIPANDAKFAASELREFGRVKPGWIGAKLQHVTPDLGAAFGMGNPEGIIVAGVDTGGPADSGDLIPGDFILAFDGRRPRDERALMRMIAETPLDQAVTVTVRRGDVTLNLSVTVKEYPASAMVAEYPFRLSSPPPIQSGDTGLWVGGLTPELRKQLRLPADVPAVAVDAVAPGSSADRIGLHIGQAILRVEAKPATAADVVQDGLKQAESDHRGQIALLVLDQNGPAWVALPIPGARTH